MVRNIIAFLVAPAIPLLLLASLLLVLGRPASAHDMEAGIMLVYLGGVIFGLPVLALIKTLRWNAIYHYVALGGFVGAITYWVVWELFPVIAAYRDGRYQLDQALRGIFFLDYVNEGIESVVCGILSGTLFWLISRPDKRAKPKSKLEA